MSWAREVRRQKNKTLSKFFDDRFVRQLQAGDFIDLSTVRARRFSRVRFVCLETFGYADRIQKYSCLLSIDDTSSQKLRQIRAYFSLALGLLML